jgi:hypothetical protein
MAKTTKLSQARHGENLEQLRRRFEHWRETRARGEHIPATLWAEAVGMAVEHGLDRVAQELQIDYDGLKKRLGQTGGDIQANQGGTQFVELMFAPVPAPQPGAPSVCECAIELENVRGAKMRVELNGNGLVDLAGLCRDFWLAA